MKFSHAQIYRYLPDEHDQMEVYVELLPSANRTAAAPWCGWVLNLNVLTHVHRDDSDIGWCYDGVITDDQFEGGDLGLVQPGIVIPLLNGDFTVFPSMENDHFNLDYKGERCSFVFQTCKEFKSWHEDRHGWIDNKYMT